MQQAAAHHNLGGQLRDRGRLAEAEAAYRRSEEVLTPLARANPGLPYIRRDLASSCLELGQVLDARGRAGEADAFFARALELWQELARQAPQVPDYQAGLRHTGIALRLRKGDHAGAARLAEEEARATPGLATDRYNAACHLARCVAAAEQDVRLPPAERKAAAEKYARRAVELLAEACKAGVATPSMLQTDPDLAPIRARADFQKLATGRQQPAPGTKP